MIPGISLTALPARPGGAERRGEDGRQLVSLSFQRSHSRFALQRCPSDDPKPQLTFVRLFGNDGQFGHKQRPRVSATRRPVVRRHGGAGIDQLFGDFSSGDAVWECLAELDDSDREILSTRFQLL